MTTINYEVDIISWANEQAWLVRNRKFELIDVEHIAEESDWDFLIMVDGPVSGLMKIAIYFSEKLIPFLFHRPPPPNPLPQGEGGLSLP